MRLAIAIALALGTTACAAAPPIEPTGAEKAVIASSVEARVDSYVDAVRRLDSEWFRGFWADVDAFVIAADGDLMGYEAWTTQEQSDLGGDSSDH
jgi:hypothetical protein